MTLMEHLTNPLVEKDLKQIITTAALVLSIFVAGYLIHVERRAAVADREFSDWIHDNDLNDFVQFFFESGIGYVDGLVHFDFDKSKTFLKLHAEQRVKLKQITNQLIEKAVLKTWLISKGLPENYVDRLRSVGITNIRQLQSLSDERLESLTQHDPSFTEYRDLMRGVSQLKDSDIHVQQIEEEMLLHHKSGFVPPGSYSISAFLFMILTTVVSVAVSFWIMLISRTQNVGSMFNLSNLSKKSLYFLTGQYDVAQHTKVTWDWDEPQTVGKTMTFNIRFFHKNGKPYPVSNTDNITVEISHGGSEVTKTMTLGGIQPEEVNLAKVSFTVHKSGDYTVCIMFSSRHIKGSPFTKKFEAGEYTEEVYDQV